MSDDIEEIALKIDERLILHTNELKMMDLKNTAYYKQAMEFLSNKEYQWQKEKILKAFSNITFLYRSIAISSAYCLWSEFLYF